MSLGGEINVDDEEEGRRRLVSGHDGDEDDFKATEKMPAMMERCLEPSSFAD